MKPATNGSGRAPLPPLTRLAQILRPDRGDLIAVTVFAVAIGVLMLATPIAVQALVNFVALGGALPPLIVVALLLFLGLGFAGVLSAVQAWIVEILQRRVFVRTVAELAARLPRVAISAHDRQYGPELVNRFFDIVTIQKVGSSLLLDGLSILLSVLVGLVVLAFYHPLLLAFDIVLLAIIALIVFAPARRGVRTAIAESKAKYAVEAWLEEIARSPLLFKSCGARAWAFERSDVLAQKYIDGRRTHYRVVFGQVVGAIALQVVASTALLGLGGLLVIQGSLTLGQLVAAELIVTMVVSSVAKMGKHLEGFYDLMAATDKVGKLLDLPLEESEGEDYSVAPEAAGPALELTDVFWAREGRPTLFEALSVTVAPGERLGICGPSGSGKTSLLELLWGLRRPDSGAIRVDGRDLRELSFDSLRRTASLVEKVEIVEGTIRDNVRLARSFVSEDDVRAALRRVNLLDELSALPDGLDTRLTATGRPLSDSQVLRLQVARAIAGSPRLLIVSDLFLQLSGTSRRCVLDALFDPEERWTLVVASNSPDVLDRCEQVLVLPDGTVTRGPLEPQPLSA